jgi:hypothetical protein
VARREQRLQTIGAAKVVLEQEAQAEAAVQQAAREARETEGPRRGRPPQPPRSVPLPKAQRNFTDPESWIMPAPGAKGQHHPRVQLPARRRCDRADHRRGGGYG